MAVRRAPSWYSFIVILLKDEKWIYDPFRAFIVHKSKIVSRIILKNCNSRIVPRRGFVHPPKQGDEKGFFIDRAGSG